MSSAAQNVGYRLMHRHELPILAIHSPFLRFGLQGWPDHPVARVKESVKLAEAVGARTVVVHPPERWVRFQTVVAGPRRSRKLTVPLPVAGQSATVSE